MTRNQQINKWCHQQIKKWCHQQIKKWCHQQMAPPQKRETTLKALCTVTAGNAFEMRCSCQGGHGVCDVHVHQQCHSHIPNRPGAAAAYQGALQRHSATYRYAVLRCLTLPHAASRCLTLSLLSTLVCFWAGSVHLSSLAVHLDLPYCATQDSIMKACVVHTRAGLHASSTAAN